MEVPPHALVVGVPGRIVTTLTGAHHEALGSLWEEYVRLSRAYKQQRPDLDVSSGL
jgi:carbonic anhydrase/acetyltransferase-like protein (isoleucine patch superfamily)